MINEDFELESRKVEFLEKEEVLKLMDELSKEDFIDALESGSLKEIETFELI